MTKRMGSTARLLALGLGSGAIVAMVALYASVGPGFGLGNRAGAEEASRPPLRGEMQHFVLQAAPAAMPDISFLDGAQQPRTLADFRGRVVLLNLWATWCGPCVEEMPSLLKLQATLASDKFTVLALSQDRAGLPLVQKFYQEHHLSGLDMFADRSSSASHSLKLRGLPTSLLLDRDGRELGRLEGSADWSSPEALALIRYYLPNKPATSPTTATELETARPPQG
jgi:thiol-disulfide isomerase/thioredoxin